MSLSFFSSETLAALAGAAFTIVVDITRSKSKGRKLEWCEVERVTDASLEMFGDGTISSGSNKVEDVVKGSPNSASVKCFGEGEDEEMCIGDSDMQDSAGRKRKRDCLLKMYNP